MVPRGIARKCQDGPLVNGVCTHLHEAISTVLDDHATLAYRMVCRLIDLSSCLNCPAVLAMFSPMVRSVVAALNHSVAEMETERNLLVERPVAAASRASPMDLDVIDELHAAIVHGAASSCQAFVPAQNGKFSDSYGQDLAGRRHSRYLASIQLTFKNYCGDISQNY